VQPEFQLRFDCREGPRISATEKLVKQFEQIDSVSDNKDVVGRKKSVRTPENIAYVQEVFNCRPNKYVQQLSQQLDLKKISTFTIVRQDKIQMQQSMGCCCNHCTITALTSSSDPNLQLFSAFLRGPNTWKSHCNTSGMNGDGPTPSSAWSTAQETQGQKLSCNTMQPIVSMPGRRSRRFPR
jgi:hypothetical protein